MSGSCWKGPYRDGGNSQGRASDPVPRGVSGCGGLPSGCRYVSLSLRCKSLDLQEGERAQQGPQLGDIRTYPNREGQRCRMRDWRQGGGQPRPASRIPLGLLVPVPSASFSL